MAMNGTITTWFEDKGFGFIKDENGDNRYFHVIKVANPELIKKMRRSHSNPPRITRAYRLIL